MTVFFESDSAQPNQIREFSLWVEPGSSKTSQVREFQEECQ